MAPTVTMDLIYELSHRPSETEWIEFKVNNSEATMIGKDISALANSAAYYDRDYAYLVWGIDDETHEIVGTAFDYLSSKARGGVLLMPWLRSMVSPNAVYDFSCVTHESLSFVVLTVQAAAAQPVSFNGKVYLRDGSSTIELKAGSAKEQELWRRLQRASFEQRINLEDVPQEELDSLLDIRAYFELMGLRAPMDPDSHLKPLLEQRLVRQQDDGRYAITNLGALLLGRNLLSFEGLSKRPIRVIRFDGDGNLDIRESLEFTAGYALALPEVERHLVSVLPGHERLEGAFRRVQLDYPRSAVRELLANAVMHQDLSYPYAGPMVRIYDHRIEFSNPGVTLVRPERVLNDPPISRNANLARQLRLMNLCEEGGTGWDRAVDACESLHLPAPKMRSDEELGTIVTLSNKNVYDAMTRSEQLEATYWHACLRFAQGETLTNLSLRERFGLDDSGRVKVSRLIKKACEAGLIEVRDEDQGNRYREYVPVLP